jgi:hypothetical protein
MITPMKIVRSVVGKDKVVFNDMLCDGGRSFKVWNCEGWHITAKRELERSGYCVELKITPWNKIRLHVR